MLFTTLLLFRFKNYSDLQLLLATQAVQSDVESPYLTCEVARSRETSHRNRSSGAVQ